MFKLDKSKAKSGAFHTHIKVKNHMYIYLKCFQKLLLYFYIVRVVRQALRHLSILTATYSKQAAFDKPFLRPVAFLKTDNILASEEGNFSVIIDHRLRSMVWCTDVCFAVLVFVAALRPEAPEASVQFLLKWAAVIALLLLFLHVGSVNMSRVVPRIGHMWITLLTYEYF